MNSFRKNADFNLKLLLVAQHSNIEDKIILQHFKVNLFLNLQIQTLVR